MGNQKNDGMTLQDAADVAIPVLDMDWNNAAVDGSVDNADASFQDPFLDYVWNGRALGMQVEGDEFESIAAFWPGVDAAINSLHRSSIWNHFCPTIMMMVYTDSFIDPVIQPWAASAPTS